MAINLRLVAKVRPLEYLMYPAHLTNILTEFQIHKDRYAQVVFVVANKHFSIHCYLSNKNAVALGQWQCCVMTQN